MHQYTPVRIVLPFILGIASTVNLPDGAVTYKLVLFLLSLFYLIFLFTCSVFRFHYGYRWVPGLFGNLSLFFIGAGLVAEIREDWGRDDSKVLKYQDIPLVCCRISGPVQQKAGGINAEAELTAMLDSTGQWQRVGTSVIVRAREDSMLVDRVYGDVLLISGKIEPVPGPLNPDVFNYRKYLYNKQVRWQVQCESHTLLTPAPGSLLAIKYWAFQSRRSILSIFVDFGIAGDELALVSALLLGSKDMLSDEITRGFSHAGAMHVLCVSGLHVGIMYVVAEKLLFFLKRGRKGRMIQQVAILVFIWAFAFITGLTPSVVRASLMFSLVALGRTMNRSVNNFNILAAAAFLQLAHQPFDMNQVGFQLSYLAVAGIFAFYPMLNNLQPYNDKALAWVGSILAVSIAAQLATAPLASHYFQIFPVYFLVTNLIVVPMAGVIIYLALVLIFAGYLGFCHEWLAWPLKFGLGFLQRSVETIQSWPGAVIEPVVVRSAEVVLFYAIITGLFFLFKLKARKAVFLMIFSVIVIVQLSIFRSISFRKGSELVVYSIPGHTAIDLINDRKSLFLCDGLLAGNSEKVTLKAGPHRVNLEVNEILVDTLWTPGEMTGDGAWRKWPFYFYRGKKLAIVTDRFSIDSSLTAINPDFLILTGKRKINLGPILGTMTPGRIIIDSSVPFYLAGSYCETAQHNGVPCHNVKNQGAFLEKW